MSLKIRLNHYLDDWLNGAQSEQICLPKFAKSQLVPTQKFQFLGEMYVLTLLWYILLGKEKISLKPNSFLKRLIKVSTAVVILDRSASPTNFTGPVELATSSTTSVVDRNNLPERASVKAAWAFLGDARLITVLS